MQRRELRQAKSLPILKDIENYLQAETARNNWLFYGSDKGGRTGAVLSTLIASCKRLRIEPFGYLRDLFTRIGTHPHQRIDELLPDKWLIAQRNASSTYEET